MFDEITRILSLDFDLLESAHEAWKQDSFVEATSVKSGSSKYAVDFNRGVQRNLDNAKHTERAVRRVEAKQGGPRNKGKRVVT